MPRQTRRLPVEITRFTYWDYEVCRPMTATELRRRARVRGRPVEAMIRARFRWHLTGPCGEPGCRADSRLASVSPSRRQELALEDYISNTREWDRDRQAHRALKALSPPARGRLRSLADRFYGRRGRRRWQTFLEGVARDQRLFASMFPAGPTTIMLSTAKAYASARKVWTAYARQALHVTGRAPGLPSAGRRSGKLSLKALTPAEHTHVVHWLAHAFRNLLRYRDGHPSRSFAPRCASTCQRVVRRF